MKYFRSSPENGQSNGTLTLIELRHGMLIAQFQGHLRGGFSLKFIAFNFIFSPLSTC
jgi:hypothetical protein